MMLRTKLLMMGGVLRYGGTTSLLAVAYVVSPFTTVAHWFAIGLALLWLGVLPKRVAELVTTTVVSQYAVPTVPLRDSTQATLGM